MEFLILNKKQGFKAETIDYDHLNKPSAPTLHSYAVSQKKYSHFDVFLYPQASYRRDINGRDYLTSDDCCQLVNGYAHYKSGARRNEDIREFVTNAKQGLALEGDYQLVEVTSEGNGFIWGSGTGWRQLYYYRGSSFEVFATSIKLIVDSVKELHTKTLLQNYDTAYIEDFLFTGPHGRRDSRKTVVKNIVKLFPFDLVQFNGGNVSIEKHDGDPAPDAYIARYQKNKQAFYDEVLETCNRFIENVFSFELKEIESITVLLTGGLDSRVTLALLYPFCLARGIRLSTSTSGRSDHPDMVIAKQISTALALDHDSTKSEFQVAKDIEDYRFNFYLSEAYWDTTNFEPIHTLDASLDREARSIALYGADCFKRANIQMMTVNSTWFSARTFNRDPFSLPLLGTKICGHIGLVSNNYGPNAHNELYGTEFVYQVLLRNTPALLDIPFVGQYLPDHPVPPYKTIQDSKTHLKDTPYFNKAVPRDLMKRLIKSDIGSFGRSPGKERIIRKLEKAPPASFFKFTKYMISLLPQQLETITDYLIRRLFLLKISYFPSSRQRAVLMDLASVANFKKFNEVLPPAISDN